MIYLNSERERDLVHFSDEELLVDWDDESDAEQVGLRVLKHGPLTVVLSYTGVGTWDVVALANARVATDNWRDKDVALHLLRLAGVMADKDHRRGETSMRRMS